jgi:hypothetical protein
VLLEKSSSLSDDALDHFQHANQLEPGNARYTLSYAQALARRELFTKANEVLVRTLKMSSPQSPDYKKLEVMQRKLAPYLAR